jgi:agmatine/peptidylarginine deiminase
MKRIIYFLFFISLSINFAQDLPNNLTNNEKELLKNYIPPLSTEGFVTPPVKSVRTMAEWEELQGILITWTSQTAILRQIVDYAQEEGLVYIVCSDSNSVKNYLVSGGVELKNLKFIIANYNSIWCRDYGPWTVYSDDIDSLYIVDWIYNRPRPQDDLIPSVFANKYGYPLYQTTTNPYNLTNTGGNFMTDGHGTGFASKLILTENSGKTESEIDNIMNKFMGIKRYIKMQTLPYDEIHHIDMHMKLLDEETLLVGQYPPGIADGPQIEANLQYILNNFLTCYGRPYKVVRIPMPPQNNLYPNNGGDYRTYTNSIIVNKTVIVPTYETFYDTTALRIYREAMPGYNVVGINCNSIIPSLGAIHCITKEIGTKQPILISHAKIDESYLTSNGYYVSTKVQTKANLSSVNLFYKTSINSNFELINMTNVTNDSFYCYIPHQPEGTTVYYYISATTTTGKTISKPLTAPSGYFKFYVTTPLAVNLISFNYFNNNNNITFNWVTGSELNSSYFELTYSEDESTINNQLIYTVPASGNSNKLNRYFCNIPLSQIKNGYYYLWEIDLAGNKTNLGKVYVNETWTLTYNLQQNYPNPFNPTTKISFSIPSKQNVNISVYNLLGEFVYNIVDKEFTAGIHTLEYSPGNIDKNISGGVYFYKITTPNFSATKKMIYLK